MGYAQNVYCYIPITYFISWFEHILFLFCFVLFFRYKVLDISDGLHDLGIIKWDILVCFIVMWIVVYLCIIRGVKTSGKVRRKTEADTSLTDFKYKIVKAPSSIFNKM